VETAPDARLTAEVTKAEQPFFWDGDIVIPFRGEADEVRLVTWMPRFPTPPPFTRLPGTSFWHLRLALPPTARIEYRLAVRHGPRWRELPDPLHPPTAANPMGVNSVIGGRHYLPFAVDPAPPGRLVEVRVTSASLGGRRHHHVYLPAGYLRHHFYPLLLIHDGSDFLRYAGLASLLDHLIARRLLPPLVVVMLDPWRRLAEYGASAAHSQHVVGEVIGHVKRRLAIRTEPVYTGLLGSSLGAVASLAAAWHHPGRVGSLGLISGTFVHRPDDEYPPGVVPAVTDFLQQWGAEPRMAGLRVYMSAGRYEGLCDLNRRQLPVLRRAGAEVFYEETWTGHDWGAWRDRLPHCLTHMFGLPGAGHH
jgi:enterochelin esterase-like enzyme